MEAMLAYLLKVSVSAILFYLFIRILMERETQHEYIRGCGSGRLSSLWFYRSYMCLYLTCFLKRRRLRKV